MTHCTRISLFATMISAIVWNPQTETWSVDSKVSRVKGSSGALELSRGGTKLICYCTKRVDGGWISALAKPEEASDEPYHCSKLPFPFMLPVYPKSQLVFVMYKEKGDGIGAAIPFHLGQRASGVGALTFVSLTLPKWTDLLSSIAEENEQGEGVYGMLQAAFDAYWDTAVDEKEDDDFVADDDVTTDLQLLQSSSAISAAPAVTFAPAAIDDDWNEEETVVDARTGFVVEKSQNVPSDDEDSSSEDDSDNEDEEDVDLDEEEDDMEDDMPDLDMQAANDDA